MSDGTLNFPGRGTAPDAPSLGRVKWWQDGNTGVPKYTNSLGETSPFGGIFGSEFQLDQKETSLTNDTNTYTSYLTTNWNNIDFENGTYRVEVKIIWSIGTTSSSFRSRLLVNGVQYGREFMKETKDSSDENIDYFTSYITPNEFNQSGLSVDLQFASENNGNTSTMWSSFITIWRVS